MQYVVDVYKYCMELLRTPHKPYQTVIHSIKTLEELYNNAQRFPSASFSISNLIILDKNIRNILLYGQMTVDQKICFLNILFKLHGYKYDPAILKVGLHCNMERVINNVPCFTEKTSKSSIADIADLPVSKIPHTKEAFSFNADEKFFRVERFAVIEDPLNDGLIIEEKPISNIPNSRVTHPSSLFKASDTQKQFSEKECLLNC